MCADGPRCVAVIITMDRPSDLDRLLDKLASQSQHLAEIVVVDNGMLSDTRLVMERHPGAIHLTSRRNLGGAGGYAYGILHALSLDAERIWIMDDDGFPETDTCLSLLNAFLEGGGYDMVSPLVLDVEDPDRLAFFYYANGRALSRRVEVSPDAVFPQFAHLFNGALLRADAFERFGLPRYELFFRGDEVEFMFRLRRGGGRFATTSRAAFLHPSGARDTVPIMGGRYHAVVPASDFARFHFYRNRGHLYREFSLFHMLAIDVVRYGWAFLITRRGDRNGIGEWWDAVVRGWKRDFTPFRPRASIRALIEEKITDPDRSGDAGAQGKSPEA